MSYNLSRRGGAADVDNAHPDPTPHSLSTCVGSRLVHLGYQRAFHSRVQRALSLSGCARLLGALAPPVNMAQTSSPLASSSRSPMRVCGARGGGLQVYSMCVQHVHVCLLGDGSLLLLDCRRVVVRAVDAGRDGGEPRVVRLRQHQLADEEGEDAHARREE